MSATIWEKTTVSSCETFHHINDTPLYNQRFEKVMKYHSPGLAPARDSTGAFHIDLEGRKAYPNRFIETFGFYEGYAAVRNKEGWFHITSNGMESYNSRFLWCGNFQEGYCPVRDNTGLYFHINQKGLRIYSKSYSYAGDYKDGYAVVCNCDGLHTHIDSSGNLLHGKWYQDLDVFHKGFARSKDEIGWFHIDKQARPNYSKRYLTIEPYYNGVARVETFEGALLTIDIYGNAITEFRKPTINNWQKLSGDMVGFWKTEIIATAAHLKLFDYFPNTSNRIAEQADLSLKFLERILRALWEIDLVYPENNIWILSKSGELLIAQNNNFLAAAARMWSDVNSLDWKTLPNILSSGIEPRKVLFKETAPDDKLQYYHQAIDGYAKQDFSSLKNLINWKDHNNIIGVGRASKVILEDLLIKHNHLIAQFLGENYLLKYLNIPKEIQLRFISKSHNILIPWNQTVDAVVLPRILHYWPDKEVKLILENARETLTVDGKIYILEMLLKENSPSGGLLDLNMLVESGGKLRLLSEWQALFSGSQLILQKNIAINPWLNLLIIGKNDENA